MSGGCAQDAEVGSAWQHQHAGAPAFGELDDGGVFAGEAIVLGECDRDANLSRKARRLELTLELAALREVACWLGVLD